jgi:hypothetical protein
VENLAGKKKAIRKSSHVVGVAKVFEQFSREKLHGTFLSYSLVVTYIVVADNLGPHHQEDSG